MTLNFCNWPSGHSDPSLVRGTLPGRPRLAARWQLSIDGKLLCR